MRVRNTIPIQAYLHTSFPVADREFRRGELIERAWPDYLHGKTQARISALFLTQRGDLALFVRVQTRMRLASDLILIPDIAVFGPTEPGRIPDTPPLVLVEVLSAGDRLMAVRRKLEAYKNWGVSNVWLVDPHLHRIYVCDQKLTEVDSLKLAELNCEFTREQIFQ